MLLVVACEKSDVELLPTESSTQVLQIPAGFPEMTFPEDNQFSQARWELGKKLFFDPVFSIDSSISCGSCHRPALAFSDDLAFSPGVMDRPGTRNAPSLANIGYHPYFLREGSVPTLEMQALVPVQEENEFNHNMVLLAEQLANDEDYIKMSQNAYDREPDPFVITRALGVFQRTLISGNSPFDQYTFQGNKSALTENEINGMNLFFSDKTDCAKCHLDFNFTNYEFMNNGLYEDYSDPGRMRFTGNEQDRALFKVPSLRNVAVTAPYMHDGSLGTLEEVLDHYNKGGENYFNKNAMIRPLALTSKEKEDIIAFLGALTDHDFLTNPNFKEPEP